MKNTRLDMDNSGGTIKQPMKLKDYFNPSSSVDFLQSPACKQDIRSNIFQMLATFYGNLNEDPYQHSKNFIRVCNVVQGADNELRITLFPFSLKNEVSY